MNDITRTAEWLDYPWEMGISRNEIFDKKTLEIVLCCGKQLHYTYVLWRKKSGFWSPFYVGKGFGKRVLTHGTASDDNANSIKVRTFAKAERGSGVFYTIKFFESAKNALQKEGEWIELIGTIHEKTGPLANFRDGGIHGAAPPARIGEKNHMSIPICVDGVKYESMSLAGNAFGISVASVRHRCDHGLWPEWVMEGVIKKTATGTRRPAQPVSVDGVIYKNIKEASRFLQIHQNSVNYRCKSPSYPTWIRMSSPNKITLKPKATKISVLAEGVMYESITKAAMAYGLSVVGMRHRCESEGFPEFEYKGSNRCPE